MVRRGGLLLLAAGVAGPCQADFRPELTFGVFHDGNISVIGEGNGDEGATLAFDLIWDHVTATSTFTFSYRPSYTAYRTFSELDYFGNRAVVGYVREWSKSSRFTIDAYAARTDRQGQTADNADTATTFVPRTTETQANVRFAGTVGAGRRGLLD